MGTPRIGGTPSGTGVFTRQEVLDCGHLLGWLAEPHDDIALVGVLRSPFFVLADDTLLALRSTGRPLLRTLADPPAAISGDERTRCEHAGGVLGELRSAAGSASAETLLELALDRTAVEAAWVPIEGGEQARANIRKLVRIARTLAGHSLSEVVEYLEQRRDDLDAREGPAVLDRTDAVQLMTVHASKGLEFPIVFVPEAHLIARGSYAAVRWRRGDGVSATMARDEDDETRPKPGFYAHLQRQDDREEAAEHRRLFYVAATRAADYLYVSGDDAGGECWLGMVRDAHASGALKTDSLNGTTAAAVTRGYLVQIGLYQCALAAAVGDAPAAGLLFLRSGELVEPDAAGIAAALIEGRARVDAGAPLDSAAEELPSSD